MAGRARQDGIEVVDLFHIVADLQVGLIIPKKLNRNTLEVCLFRVVVSL
jgi:hypothetical protein